MLAIPPEKPPPLSVLTPAHARAQDVSAPASDRVSKGDPMVWKAMILAGVLVVAALGTAAFVVRQDRDELETLRREAQALKDQRDALLGSESITSRLEAKLLKTEQALEAAQRQLQAATAGRADREEELQKVIRFLREEIKAAEATIADLKSALAAQSAKP